MSKSRYANALEQARVSAENCPARFRSKRHGAILLEVLASVYGKEEGGSDTAVWLDVVREEVVGGNGRFPWLFGLSPARVTMGVLD